MKLAHIEGDPMPYTFSQLRAALAGTETRVYNAISALNQAVTIGETRAAREELESAKAANRKFSDAFKAMIKQSA